MEGNESHDITRFPTALNAADAIRGLSFAGLSGRKSWKQVSFSHVLTGPSCDGRYHKTK